MRVSPKTSRAAAGRAFSLRHLLLVAFFVGLLALEVGHGLFRLETLRGKARLELLERLEREHALLAQDLDGLLGEGRRHAAYLARLTDVAALLQSGDPAAAAGLERQLLSYLVSFRGIDRVRLLDAQGRERFRCERIGGGVGVIPAALLQPESDQAIVRLASARRLGEVVVSKLFVDSARVEVSESDRQVFHYVTALEEGGATLGYLAVTVYAAALQHALAAFQPMAGIETQLFDEHGAAFAELTTRETGRAERAARPTPDPATLAELLAGASPWTHAGATHWLAHEVGSDPRLVLASAVPESALESATGSLAGEQARVVASVVVIGLSISIASAFFLRTSLRALRLREAERESEKYRALLEGAADMILIVDPATESVRECNSRAREALGIPPPPPAGGALALETALAGQDLAPFRAALSAAAAGSEPVAVRALRLRAHDGRALEVDGGFAGIEYGGERVVQMSLRDVTRERELERSVQTSERLSSLGLLTAGVAHEINNPLEGIGNYLSLLQRDGVPREQHERYLAQVRHGFERIKNIVGELLRFARPRVAQGTADLGAVVEGALSVARYSKELKDVQVELVGLQQRVYVLGDPGRLEQVLLNLLLNAGRAMQARGRLRIAAESGEREVVLKVQDEGPGIAVEDLDRIFDPFFSRSDSTGLGLAVSYGIVHAHGGTLTAHNRAEGGAELAITLPRAPAPERAGAQRMEGRGAAE